MGASRQAGPRPQTGIGSHHGIRAYLSLVDVGEGSNPATCRNLGIPDHAVGADFHGLCQAVLRVREGRRGAGWLTARGGGLDARLSFEVRD